MLLFMNEISMMLTLLHLFHDVEVIEVLLNTPLIAYCFLRSYNIFFMQESLHLIHVYL